MKASVCMEKTMRKLASWQVGNARILNSNYYNSLVINDSNILEEKTRGLPSCQLANFFMLAGREEFARANLLFSASKPLLYSLNTVNTIVSIPKHHTYDS